MPARASPRAKARAIASLAEGNTVPQAAEFAEVHERTVWRWLEEPEVRNEIAALKRQMIQRVADRLCALGTSAVDTLTALLADESPSIRLGAVRTTLDFGLRVQEQILLAERLAEVEARLANLGLGEVSQRNGHGPLSHRRVNFGGV